MRPASLFRRKGLDRLVGETVAPEHQLKRALGPVQLTLLGIGAIIGAGIFSTVGTAAAGAAAEAGASGHLGAGPALVLSFVLVAVACGFAALCYSEFASMVPVSGSAYTYAYATLGELIAWIIGWDLILEYAVGNVAVAISWSDYFQSLLAGFKITWPVWLGTDYRTALQAVHDIAKAKAGGVDPSTLGDIVARGGHAWADAPRLLGLPIIFNLPAVLIVALITWVLVRGIKESAGFNSAMVILKLVIIAFFLAVGACYVKPANWTPFAPNGFAGISSAAAIIFFAYIGFDAVSTAAEETRNPMRDVPIGIIGSLVVCTVIYVAVAMVLTGMVKWDQFKGVADPLAKAFSDLGMNWTAGIISFGAVFATTSVLLVFQLGQPRIFFSMARDGLLPPWAAKVHPKYRTPHVTTILTGVFVAVFAAVTNINEVVELCNIGTLFAFVLVAAGIMVLRKTDPSHPRPFRTPCVPVVPLLAILTCGWLMTELPNLTWLRFQVWLELGLLIYLGYGQYHSRLRDIAPPPPPASLILRLASGRRPLWEAFWIYRVGLGLVLAAGISLAQPHIAKLAVIHPKVGWSCLAAEVFLWSCFYFWSLISVWNCAANSRPTPRITARVFVGLVVVADTVAAISRYSGWMPWQW
jgi:basic amino acid/polyamine antiporter, APA family